MVDKKLLKKAKNKLNRSLPGAKITIVDGLYTIIDSDGIDILDLYLLPKSEDLLKTYELGVISARTTQLFDRTHPDRLSLESKEEKSDRINRKRDLV